MKHRRISTLFFTLLLCLSALCALASCDAASKEGSFVYEETEDGYAVTALLTGSRSVTIPSEHNGRKVVAIKESAFYRNEYLRSVTIPSSVGKIGAYAFADCVNLHSVTFEEGGNCRIDDSAFEGCTLLLRLAFNGSVTSVGDRAFRDCRRISHLKVGRELTDAFMNCERMLISAPDNSTAYRYAIENHLCIRFTDSVYFLYLEIGGGVLLMGALLFAVHRFIKKRVKNAGKAKEKQEK